VQYEVEREAITALMAFRSQWIFDLQQYVDVREMVSSLAFPPNEQSAESTLPRVGSFDRPATVLAANTTKHRRLTATADVRDDAADDDLGFGIGVVVGHGCSGPTKRSVAGSA
jgi:hypothetical protein